VNVTDEALMGQVQEGDVRKLALLFERHHRRLFNFFVHMNGDRSQSEDLVQEVFFRILRYRGSYDASRPYSAWMFQIARNLHNEQVTRGRGDLRLVPSNEEQDQFPSGAPGIEETLLRRQEIGLLNRALDKLPDDKREVLVLSRFQNMKYEEIAQILGCEVGAVKVRVYRAIRALGQIYQELSGEKAS